MIERISIHRGRHRDSVTLMLASNDAATVEGVDQASAVTATPINLELLARAGFGLAEDEPLGPSDLVVAIRARDEEVIAAAIAAVEARLGSVPIATEGSPRPPAPSLLTAARRRPEARLALISVPGPNAAHECAAALDAGMHVFCFSSGFGPELELALKRRASELGLLMMGPDCGTAILDGTGIGFANEVESGPVGVVGASGTGMQQLVCLLDHAGVGISQAIGVGGRDLGAEIGGLMALDAIALLGADPATELIALVAKSPDPAVAGRVAAAIAATGKPGVLCFPGFEAEGLPPGIDEARTLEGTAAIVARRLGGGLELPEPVPGASGEGLIRGLFCGGTLRDEALAIVSAGLDQDGREPPLALAREPRPEEASRHLLIDFGSEELTLGRPHPMIDPSLRDAAVSREAANPAVSVLLADVVLGRGAHPDPAGGLAAALEELSRGGRDDVSAVVSLCGARRDPQGLDAQAARLREAGAVVTASNAEAARLALSAAGAGGGRR